MVIKFIIGATCTCLAVVSYSANAALVSRLGGLAYYDTEADLTWLADANYAQTSGYDADGKMNWADANSWAASLNVGGVDGWRLPDTIDVGHDGGTYLNGNLFEGVDAGYNMTTHSEMSNMFYNVLGNSPHIDVTGSYTGCGSSPPNYCLTNTGPFSNLQSSIYWSATESFVYNTAWFFDMNTGYQLDSYGKSNSLYAWAVQSGDVSAVPVPAAVWLFSSGLIGLIGVARIKKV